MVHKYCNFCLFEREFVTHKNLNFLIQLVMQFFHHIEKENQDKKKLLPLPVTDAFVGEFFDVDERHLIMDFDKQEMDVVLDLINVSRRLGIEIEIQEY